MTDPTAPAPDPADAVTAAAINPDGTPGPVAPNELIESAWGNAVATNISDLVLRARLFSGVVAGGAVAPNASFNAATITVPAGFAGRPGVFVHHLTLQISGSNAAVQVVLLNPATEVVAIKYVWVVGAAEGPTSVTFVYPVTALTVGAWIFQVRTDGSNNTVTVPAVGTQHAAAGISFK